MNRNWRTAGFFHSAVLRLSLVKIGHYIVKDWRIKSKNNSCKVQKAAESYVAPVSRGIPRADTVG